MEAKITNLPASSLYQAIDTTNAYYGKPNGKVPYRQRHAITIITTIYKICDDNISITQKQLLTQIQNLFHISYKTALKYLKIAKSPP